MPSEPIAPDDLEALLGPASTASHLIDQTDAVLFVVDRPDRIEGADTERPAEHGDLAGAGLVTLASVIDEPRAHLQLLAVTPTQRRRGVARSIVAAAEQWALQHGSTTLTVGAGAPFYLFTGVDSRWIEALCAFEALGYERIDTELDLRCPTRGHRPRRSSTAGSSTVGSPSVSGSSVVVEPVRDDQAAAALASFAEAHWPLWAAEFARAARSGTVFMATDAASGAVLGAAAHSVGRLGVVGPVAVDPGCHGRGVGTALMGAVLTELSVAGLDSVEIAWTSTVRFYSLACDARVARASVVLRRDLTG